MYILYTWRPVHMHGDRYTGRHGCTTGRHAHVYMCMATGTCAYGDRYMCITTGTCKWRPVHVHGDRYVSMVTEGTCALLPVREGQWLSRRADFSEPGGPGFESSSRQIYHSTHLCSIWDIFLFEPTELDQVFTEEISRRLQIILVSIK